MPGFSFRLTRDDISPKLTRLAATAKRPAKVLRAMGTAFMGITMGTFNNGEDYRPQPWPAKKDGSPSNLQKSGTLSRSFHLEVTDQYAKVANPTIYAATHQFGRPQGGGEIPARPFYPVTDNRLSAKAEEKIAAAGRIVVEKEVD